jgi:SAM-dependent methyltransferase
LLPIVASVLVIALHLLIGDASPWREATLALLIVPIVLGALGHGRRVWPLLLTGPFALANDVIDAPASQIAVESLIVIVVMVVGWRLAGLIDDELATSLRLRSEMLQRLARLKTRTGYWQRVALTQMGVYVTGVEERFLDGVMGARPGGVVLDVGAGGGRLEHVISRYAGRVIATDIDRDEIYSMADYDGVAPVVVGPVATLPVKSGAVDEVVVIEVPAASDEEWFREECARVLRPGGRVLMTVYNASSYKGLWTRAVSRLRGRQAPPWAGLYYRMSLREQLQRWALAGFEPGITRGFYWSPLPRSSESRWVLASAALERLLGLRGLTGLSPWVLVELRKTDSPAQT